MSEHPTKALNVVQRLLLRLIYGSPETATVTTWVPTNAEACPRTWAFGDGVNKSDFTNVRCPECGDVLLAHDDGSDGWEQRDVEVHFSGQFNGFTKGSY